MRANLYDSMASASSGEGISLELVRRAKRAGCDAFRGSRVDGGKLRQFISEHGAELKLDDGDLKDVKLSEEIRKLKIKNDRDERRLILRSDVAVKLETYVSAARAIFEQRLLNEAPVATSGLEPAQIRIKNRQILDEAWADMNKLKSIFL